jgi:hypothetical protein
MVKLKVVGAPGLKSRSIGAVGAVGVRDIAWYQLHGVACGVCGAHAAVDASPTLITCTANTFWRLNLFHPNTGPRFTLTTSDQI